jgi:hypothetical protein
LVSGAVSGTMGPSGTRRSSLRRIGARAMFGPLPLLHRIMLALVTAASGVLAGAWAAHVTPLPLAVSMGALVGGLVGLGAAYVVVHQPQPRPVRVTRRR